VRQRVGGGPEGEEVGQEGGGRAQREALATKFRAKLSALDQTLEEQWIQQTKAVERL
jgi:hypothetical protein